MRRVNTLGSIRRWCTRAVPQKPHLWYERQWRRRYHTFDRLIQCSWWMTVVGRVGHTPKTLPPPIQFGRSIAMCSESGDTDAGTGDQSAHCSSPIYSPLVCRDVNYEWNFSFFLSFLLSRCFALFRVSFPSRSSGSSIFFIKKRKKIIVDRREENRDVLNILGRDVSCFVHFS